MLRDYRLSYFLPIGFLFNTQTGFCNYIKFAFSRKYVLSQFSILYSLKPADHLWYGGHWFYVGDLRPRIKLLKKAIKKTKELIEDYRNNPDA